MVKKNPSRAWQRERVINRPVPVQCRISSRPTRLDALYPLNVFFDQMIGTGRYGRFAHAHNYILVNDDQ